MRQQLSKLATSLSLAWLYLLIQAPILALAQGENPGTNEKGEVTTKLADPQQAYGLLGSLISMLLRLAIMGAAIVAFIYLILGAFQWGTAASGEGAAKGRKTILYAVAGLIMSSLVYVFIFVFNQIGN